MRFTTELPMQYSYGRYAKIFGLPITHERLYVSVYRTVLAVVILSIRPSVCLSVTRVLSDKPNNALRIF